MRDSLVCHRLHFYGHVELEEQKTVACLVTSWVDGNFMVSVCGTWYISRTCTNLMLHLVTCLKHIWPSSSLYLPAVVAFALVVLRLCPITVVTQVINILIVILTDAQVWAGSAKGPHDQR